MAQVLQVEIKYDKEGITKAKANYLKALEIAKTELPEKEGTGGMQEAIVDRAI
jgi:hypothetical protein